MKKCSKGKGKKNAPSGPSMGTVNYGGYGIGGGDWNPFSSFSFAPRSLGPFGYGPNYWPPGLNSPFYGGGQYNPIYYPSMMYG